MADRQRHLGDPLTPRELDVLVAMADGRTGATTARDLGMSVQTLKNHLTSVYDALDASGLVSAYHLLGWLRPSPIAELEQRERDVEARLGAIKVTTDALLAELRAA